MILRPPRSTRTDTLFPYTTLFRSVRIATFSGATRIVNIENPETQEVGSFTFSNFGGSVRFTQANAFLEIRSADVIPGSPALISSETLSDVRPEEHTSELQSLMRISYAVFCLKKKKTNPNTQTQHHNALSNLLRLTDNRLHAPERTQHDIHH